MPSDFECAFTYASGLVPERNLERLLRYLAERVGYAFDERDWEVIGYGLDTADCAAGLVFEYPFEGRTLLRIRLCPVNGARGESIVFVQVLVPTLCRSEAVAVSVGLEVFSEFAEEDDFLGLSSALLRYFAGAYIPEAAGVLACDAAHREICGECQEVESNFAGRMWQDALLRGWTPPMGYAHIVFLNDAAREFYLPAYLATALRLRDVDYWTCGFDAVKDRDLLSEPQTEFVLAVRRLVHETAKV